MNVKKKVWIKIYLSVPPKNKNVRQNFSQGDKLSLSDQILAQTLSPGQLSSIENESK